MQHLNFVWFAAADRFFVCWNFLNKSNMIRIICIMCLAAATRDVQAQKADLKKLCSEYEQLLLSDKNFHLEYTLTVAGRADTMVEKMNFDLYKSKDKDYIKMGDAQVLIHDGTFLLIVNHEVRTIRFTDDSSNLNSKNALVSDFVSIIDSSAAVSYASKDNLLTYTLSFPPKYGYESLQLAFSKKTKHLLSIYAVFAPDYDTEFRYIRVVYKEPDVKWIPGPSFPDTATYITKQNGRYVIQEAFDSYKTY